MRDRCLFCYQPLTEEDTDFHPLCSKKFFGTAVPPELPYAEEEMQQLGLQIVQRHMTVTGVQPKVSLELPAAKKNNGTVRFTIVGLWGSYILKPPAPAYPFMPENEDLTMHLARIAGIGTVPHSLIRLRSGNLAYITRRIDRTAKHKIPMEDMCQLTGRLTEHKYDGSYEQIARAILSYSSAPGLDVVNFCEMVLFSFLTGNADMHLKNFSLIDRPGFGMVLAPAYDMLATALLNPSDTEEMALTLNGKKRNLRKNDFLAAFTIAGLDEKQQRNIFQKHAKHLQRWLNFIEFSFLPAEHKEQYVDMISSRNARLTM